MIDDLRRVAKNPTPFRGDPKGPLRVIERLDAVIVGMAERRKRGHVVPPLLISLLLLAVTSPILWLVRPHRMPLAGILAAIPPALVTIWQLSQINAITQGIYLTEQYAWASQIGLEIALRLDGLALFFGLIVTGIGAAVAWYTGFYFEDDERQGYFYSLLYLFMASMLGLVWADNLLTLFVFWEGTSITSYLLIAFKYQYSDAKEGGRRAFIVTGLGGLAMLVGIVLLGFEAGTYNITQIVNTPGLTQSPLYPAALVLLLIGAFTKSAQFPFHFWLPGAMAAPTPASAYLHSATMVKAGVYLLARLHPALSDSPLWFWSLLLFGGATMLLGAISAIRYYDIKALLAYATVSQLGILVMLLAFNTEKAIIAVTVGIMAHALYKGPLFLLAGIVDHATGTRDLRKLAGLWRPMPWVALAAILAGISMAGLPPTFGFLAKETLLEAFHRYAGEGFVIIGWGSLIAGAVAGAFFVAYSFTLLWEAFLRKDSPEEPATVHHAPGFLFVLPPLALTLLGAVIPLTISRVEKALLAPPVKSIANADVEVHLALWHGFTPVLIISLVAIGSGFLLFLARTPLRALLNSTPAHLNGVYIFNRINDATYGLANQVTRRVQGSTMASQISIVFTATVSMLVVALTQIGALPQLEVVWTQQPALPEMIIALLAVVAAIVTMRTRSRLGAIISLGVVGWTVTLFFIFFSAPDLALTQLLIEVLTLVLLVLVFFRIKPDNLPPIPRSRLIRNSLVAGAMGVFGFVVVLLNNSIQVGAPISEYFQLYSVPLGYGGNEVNVILVDFRGFDTLGEITVLAVAALGGYALLRAPRLQTLRGRSDGDRGQTIGYPGGVDASKQDGHGAGATQEAATPLPSQNPGVENA